jgi:hypothetical protein
LDKLVSAINFVDLILGHRFAFHIVYGAALHFDVSADISLLGGLSLGLVMVSILRQKIEQTTWERLHHP